MRDRFGGFIFGGGYTWRGLFSEFYCIATTRDRSFEVLVSSVPVGPLSISKDAWVLSDPRGKRCYLPKIAQYNKN